MRSSDEQAQNALQHGAWVGWKGSLQRVPAIGAEGRFLVDAKSFILNGAFVEGWPFEEFIVAYRVQEVRCYETNVLIDIAMQVLDSNEQRVPLVVSLSLLRLPQIPMKPRQGDDRLGYFMVDFMDLGEHPNKPGTLLSDKVDVQNSWIQRFDLTRNDGKIRFYVDPTVPERWRPYFKEGVEAWNVAFKAIGHDNAVQAILPGDPLWPEDFDSNDARYSTISWSLDSSGVYALGLAKVDPRSGEIQKSDIIVTAGWVHAWLDELDLEAPAVTRQTKSYRREARQRRERKAPASATAKRSNPFLRNRARYTDTPMDLSKAELSFQVSPMTFAAANAKMSDIEWEDVIGKGLKSVVMHETGHSLGLRHNFKASTGIPVDCLKNATCTKLNSLSLSIMDYVPANVFGFQAAKEGGERPDIFPPCIGLYDKLTIQYGYGTWNGPELTQLLEKAEELPTCTDEDSDGSDPLCQVHDLGANPLVFYKERLRLLGEEQKSLLDMSVGAGESYTRYGEATLSVMDKTAYIGQMLTTFLGGISTHHMHRGSDGIHRDGKAAMVIPDYMQNEALSMIIDIFNTSTSDFFPPDSSRRFLLVRKGEIGTGSIDIAEEKRALRRFVLKKVTSPEVFARLYASEKYDSAPNFGLDNLLSKLSEVIFPAGSDLLSGSPGCDWETQSMFLSGLKQTYLSRCEDYIPVEVLSKVLNHLQSQKESIESKHSDLMRIKHNAHAHEREHHDLAEAQAYLAFMKSELADIDKPCRGVETVRLSEE
jgi:hypothetical protein